MIDWVFFRSAWTPDEAMWLGLMTGVGAGLGVGFGVGLGAGAGAASTFRGGGWAGLAGGGAATTVAGGIPSTGQFWSWRRIRTSSRFSSIFEKTDGWSGLSSQDRRSLYSFTRIWLL